MLRRGLLALAALLLLTSAAKADSLTVQTCGTLPLAYTPGDVRNDTVDVNGNKCISGSISASSSLNATAALPTLGAGAQSPQGSLAGAAYVQPVFGSASGGGTQVDLSNGLPVNVLNAPSVSTTGISAVTCVSGCSAGASTVTTTQGTVPWIVSGTVTTTPSSIQSVSSTGQLSVYVLGTPTVSTTGQQTVLVGGVPSVSSTGQISVGQVGAPWAVSSTGQSWVTGTVGLFGTPSVSTTGKLTVNVDNTPAVSSTGKANVNVDNTPSVSSTGVQAVNVVNTPTVSTTGKLTVNVDNLQTVSGTGQQWVTGTVLVTGTQAASDGLSNPTSSNILAYILGWDPTGSVWRRAQVQGGAQFVAVSGTPSISSTGKLTVNVDNTPSVSTTGKANVNVDNTPAISSTGDSWVTGTFRLQDATSTPVQNVKAASTSATSTDTAAVVALSPNPVTICTSFKNISVATSTDLITSVNFLHICSILLVETSAQTVSLVEGTGTLCASGETPIIGGTLASGGLPLAANGGFNQASGIPFLRTKTMADHLCLLQSGSTSSTGYISYVDHQ